MIMLRYSIVKILAPAAFCIFISVASKAQTLPLGFPMAEDAARRSQLLGTFDSTVSFTLKPLHADAFADSPGYLKGDTASVSLYKELVSFSKGAGSVALLPLQWRADFNNNRPYGVNNGAMIPATGLQSVVSAGIFAKWGPLQVQLRPEMLYAANTEFDGFAKNHYEVVLMRRYSYTWNYIDMPDRMGDEPHREWLPGQSSVRLTYKGVSAGYSTENIWWGPGRYNSLLMTNHARGFKHVTLNTVQPIKTPIGHFEAQLIGGRLEASGYYPPDTGFVYLQNRVYWPKTDGWRYLNGIVATYQPKWVRGLTVGGARVVQQYGKTAWTRKNYLSVFSGLFGRLDGAMDDVGELNQMASLFARWVWEEANMEIYTEYGRNNTPDNLRNLLLSPQNARAYVLGFSRLLPLKRKNTFIEFNTEFTHLEQSGSLKARAAPSWYSHEKVRHGYTHHGEVVGAGVGPGGNMQYVGVHWVKGFNKLGLFFERVVNNNDFMYSAFNDSKDFRRYWIDIGGGITADFSLGHFLLSGKVQTVKAINYQWELFQEPGQPYFVNGRDLGNVYMSVNMGYAF